MPRPLQAAGCAANTLSYPAVHSTSLWISDNLLAETWHKFIHRQRRYGSHVPGPLEARRRAHGRRNTSLAYTGLGGGPIDLAIVLNPGNQKTWWKQPEEKSQSGVSIFSSWLLKPSQPPPAPPDRPVYDHIHAQVDPGTVEALQSRLEACRTINQVVGCVAELKINLRQIPQYSEVVLQHMLTRSRTSTRACQHLLAHYLREPRLNPPGSSNALLTMKDIVQTSLMSKAKVKVLPAILDAIRLGLVPVADIEQIVHLLPLLKEKDDARKNQRTSRTRQLRVMEAIEASGVILWKDFSQSTLEKWYTELGQLTPSESSVVLMLKIGSCLGTDEFDIHARIAISYLEVQDRPHNDQRSPIFQYFEKLPTDIRGALALRISQHLVNPPITASSESPLNQFKRWHQVLMEFNHADSMTVTVSDSVWKSHLSRPTRLSSQENFILLLWTVDRLYLPLRRPQRLRFHQKLKLEKVAQQTFVTNDGSNHGPYESILMAMSTLPLPDVTTVFVPLKAITKLRPNKATIKRRYADYLRALSRREVQALLNDQYYRIAKRHQPGVIAILAEYLVKDIAAFAAAAQSLIMKNKLCFRIVTRILAHHLGVKLALSVWPDSPGGQKLEVKRSRPDIDPNQVNDMLHDIAVAYAVTPTVSPRSAFRCVRQIYLYMHRYGGEIRPIMARALWHAGVTRYGEGQISNMQFKWCYERIYEHEGRDVATALLFSRALRARFCEEIEAVRVAFENSAPVNDRYLEQGSWTDCRDSYTDSAPGLQITNADICKSIKHAG